MNWCGLRILRYKARIKRSALIALRRMIEHRKETSSPRGRLVANALRNYINIKEPLWVELVAALIRQRA